MHRGACVRRGRRGVWCLPVNRCGCRCRCVSQSVCVCKTGSLIVCPSVRWTVEPPRPKQGPTALLHLSHSAAPNPRAKPASRRRSINQSVDGSIDRSTGPAAHTGRPPPRTPHTIGAPNTKTVQRTHRPPHSSPCSSRLPRQKRGRAAARFDAGRKQ